MKNRPSRFSGRARANRRAAAVMLTPWLLGTVFITLIPLGATLVLSLTSYNPMGPPSWIGLDNYTQLIADGRFRASVWVTVVYVAISVPLQLVLALTVALLLKAKLRGSAFYQAAYYLPSMIGVSVAIAILWRQVFGEHGLVNTLLGVFGIDGPNWISDPRYALGTLIALNVWTFGTPMIIFLAGLKQIPREYYEAASLDGAGRVRNLLSITLPLLSPIILFNVILQMIGAFQAFTPAYIISGGRGGPVDSTLFITLLLYTEGFTNLRMGYAAAMAVVVLAVIGLMTALNFALSRYWTFYGDER